MPASETKEVKFCLNCGDKPVFEFSKNGASPDGLATYCKACDRERVKQFRESRKKREQEEPDQFIKQIESGEFQVDQKWLLIELMKLYKDPTCRDKLNVLRMISQISGYDKDTSDDKAIIASLMAGMKKGE